ncbi:MAG: flavin reductase family protein [Chlorobi bacterium]|nr:flavin reductase family protein [Chlorobiota bacterium]
MNTIPINRFIAKPTDIWLNDWFLLTSGNFNTKEYNTMTVAWGFFGNMWSMPVAVVVVRPTRYTYEFINKYDTFTLSAFDKKYKPELNLLGTKSGRDGDKIAESGLTPIESNKIEAPAFKEAELIIECEKIYWDDFKPANFLNPNIEKKYPIKDYHRMYFGKILEIKAIDKYKIV